MRGADLSIGRWALLSGYGEPLSASVHDIRQIINVTAKLVKTTTDGGWNRQHLKTDVLATFADKADAVKLAHAIAGLRGERDRRVAAANEAAREALDKVLARARGEAA